MGSSSDHDARRKILKTNFIKTINYKFIKIGSEFEIPSLKMTSECGHIKKVWKLYLEGRIDAAFLLWIEIQWVWKHFKYLEFKIKLITEKVWAK